MEPTVIAALVTAVGGLALGVLAAVKSLRPQRIVEYDKLLDKYTRLVDDLEVAIERLGRENRKLDDRVGELEGLVRKLRREAADP